MQKHEKFGHLGPIRLIDVGVESVIFKALRQLVVVELELTIEVVRWNFEIAAL